MFHVLLTDVTYLRLSVCKGASTKQNFNWKVQNVSKDIAIRSVAYLSTLIK